MNTLKTVRRAFTLVEIMIVVLIIGILLAIAVPNFIRARESSRAKACVSNLRQVDSAKEQFAMDNKLGSGGTITNGMTDLLTYIKKTPECPSGGTYTIGAVGTDPTCSVGGTGATAHTL